MNVRMQHPGQQRGVMLLEALVAILIFSIGILAIVGLQATSISLSTDAKYRSDASMLANQIIGMMWNDIGGVSALAPPASFTASQFSSYIGNNQVNAACNPAGTAFERWSCTILDRLPNATAAVSFGGAVPLAPPTTSVVTPLPAVANSTQTSSTSVTVTITWQLPNATAPHSYTTTAQIGAQKRT